MQKTASTDSYLFQYFQLTGDVPTLEGSSLTQSIQHSAVSLVIPVGKVEAGNVHASVHQLSQILWAPRGRPDGANDFGAALLSQRRFFHHVKSDKAARQHGHFGSVGDHDAVCCNVFLLPEIEIL